MQRTYQLSDLAPLRTEGAIAALLGQAGRRHRFAGGETIQQQGDADRGFWLVEAGRVMACRFGREGALTIFAVLGPGDLIGELAHFSGVPRQVDLRAESDAVLVRIDAPTIDRLLAAEPLLVRWLLHSLASQLRIALDRIEQNRSMPAAARLARTLADLAAQGGPDIAVTQQELADFVGVSRVTAGQALGELTRAGLIARGYGKVIVRDAPGLTALSD